MRAVWLAILMMIVASGCRLGSKTPARDRVRRYDMVPQSGYLAEGPTVTPDYAAPPPSGEAEARFDEATYRATIQRDLMRINGLLDDNDRMRQELAAAQAALVTALGEIEKLGEKITALEAARELARARAVSAEAHTRDKEE